MPHFSRINMFISRKYLYAFLLPLFMAAKRELCAQNLPLGSWTAQIPLNRATSVCQSTNYVYSACSNGVISVNVDNNFIESYTKVSGLAEVFVSQVGYDTATSTLVIGYQNSNIDLIRNGKITNLPYLKDASIAGDKKVYYIFCTDSIAYIGTGFGMLKVNLVKDEISETYIFNDGSTTLRVNAIWADQQSIFAATTKGVVMGTIALNVNLLNFNDWVQFSSGIPQTEATAVTRFQGKVIAAVGSSLYQYDGSNWTTFFTDANWVTMQLNNSFGQLLMAQQKIIAGNVTEKRLAKWNGSAFTFFTDGNIERPLQLVQDKNGTLWHADLFRGLVHQEGTFNIIAPNAPPELSCKEMEYLDGTLWVTSSDIRNSWSPVFNRSGIYYYRDLAWSYLDRFNTPALDTFYDVAVVKSIPSQHKLIFGSQTGILEYDVTNQAAVVNKYRPGASNPAERVFRITGSDRDADDNVWMSDAYSITPIVCRKADGTYKYFNTGFLNGKLATDIVTDDIHQVWITKDDLSGGLVVFNYGNDIDDVSDDTYYNFSSGSGAGNLPVNRVVCIAKDNEGTMWLGTTQGISIVSCGSYITENACEAEQICIDRNDGSGFCDNLLEDEIINCITVDAANRKWIGTNNGLFLVSADGRKTIHYFNETNSPLLANYVRSITINPDNGDVFIGTEKGICTYRGEATTTSDNTPAPYVYPNPVRHEYTGPIAFAGIPNNCNVKITDESGNLVFETTALGGQATWDGNLTNGQRAATGIYFALCKGSDKKEKAKLKFVLIH